MVKATSVLEPSTPKSLRSLTLIWYSAYYKCNPGNNPAKSVRCGKRESMNPQHDFEKRYRLVREVIETIVLTVLMFLVIRFAVQNFNIEGHSMEPNLHDQELILVDKWTYLFRPPARGDVIVFIAPPQPTQDYIKRIIAVPGDTITIQNTTVIVDGVTLNESYVDPKNQGNQYDYKHIYSLVVPRNDYFVLGDNRAGSYDSRA